MDNDSADLDLGPLSLSPGHSLTLEERWTLQDEAAWLMIKGSYSNKTGKLSSSKRKNNSSRKIQKIS